MDLDLSPSNVLLFVIKGVGGISSHFGAPVLWDAGLQETHICYPPGAFTEDKTPAELWLRLRRTGALLEGSGFFKAA